VKEIMAVIRINKMNETKKALEEVGITSYSATGRVMGRGKGLVDYKLMHGAEEGHVEAMDMLGDGPRLVPKRLVTVIVSDEWKDKTIKAIIDANSTGTAGDGKIFVMPIDEAVRVRTGEIAVGEDGGDVLDSSGGVA